MTLRAGRCQATAFHRPLPRLAPSSSLPSSLSSPWPVRSPSRSSLQVRRTFGGTGFPEVQVQRTRDRQGGVQVWMGQGVQVA